MRSGNRKLTAEQIVTIREAVAANPGDKHEIARQFGVAVPYLYAIARGAVRANAGGPFTTGWRAPRGWTTRPSRPTSNTGFWGVTANGIGNRFDVTIRENGRPQSLGRFRDPITAAKAYDRRARDLGFPPERLNFPEDAE